MKHLLLLMGNGNHLGHAEPGHRFGETVELVSELGEAEPTREDVVAVKQLLARHLAPHSSAILMDPNWAYPLSIGEVPPRVGLILSYEHHVTENAPGGRMTVPIPDWSVGKTRRIGADA